MEAVFASRRDQYQFITFRRTATTLAISSLVRTGDTCLCISCTRMNFTVPDSAGESRQAGEVNSCGRSANANVSISLREVWPFVRAR